MKKAIELLKAAKLAKKEYDNSISLLEEEIMSILPNVKVSCSSIVNPKYFDLTTDHFEASNFLEKDFEVKTVACSDMPETEEAILQKMREMNKEKASLKDAIEIIEKLLKEAHNE